MVTYRYEGPPLIGGIKPEHPVAGRVHSFTALLGLWQGAWDDKPSDTLAKARGLEKNRRVPLGMGIVVPASKIAETLNQPEFVMARRKQYQDE
jgi:hypothetical protein